MIFVVAEIGVNWDGNFDLVKDMMKNAKEVGCNAVKFQAFDEPIVRNHPEKSRLIRSAISSTNIETIDKLSKIIGIEWFCTPMYPAAVDLLDPFVKRFKMREMDGRSLLKNETSLLSDKILQTKKQILVSSETSPHNCKYFNNPQIKWLYCVPKYPCDLEDLDFRSIKNFHGYSNHCTEILAPLSAAILGAGIIEIHITSDKTKNFVDNNVSLDYTELKELVGLIRLSEKIRK
jgi:sialic acid synthase SpsE